MPESRDSGGTAAAGHKLVVLNREDTTITGVLNVDRFDDDIIVVDTELGTLVLRGQGLHIQQLDLDEGTFKVEGLVTALEYTGGSRRREGGQSLLERLFR